MSVLYPYMHILLAILLSALLFPDRLSAQASPPLTVITEELAPYNYLQDRELKGVCSEVVFEILRRTSDGVAKSIRVLPWSRAYAKALHQPNVALFSTVRTPEREHKFQWVGPIFHDNLVMMKRRGSRAQALNMEEAKQYTIGVMQDYAAEDLLRSHQFTRVHRLPGAPEQMIYMLAHDRVDMWLESQLSGAYYAARAGKPSGWIEPLFVASREEMYIAFSLSSDPKIVRRWNEALEQMRLDGTYDAIIKQFEKQLPQ